MRSLYSLCLLVCMIANAMASTIVQDQGKALCDLLASTNIASLRDQGAFVGWRCEYDSAYGSNLPYEDNKVTVCGNRFLDCNSTMIGTSGCSDKYGNTTQLESWTGITCDDSNPFNVNFLVSEIRLAGKFISGNIPTSIGKLSALRVLDLSDNSFSGTVYSMINTFASNGAMYLQSLRLESNSFSSSIPASIGDITTLESLGLYSNYFSNVIPSELGALTKLTSIEINNNGFSGAFPESPFYLPALQVIDAYSNSFTGLPTLSSEASLLRSVKFNNNDITTSIFDVGNWGDNMPEVRTLWLHSNDLTGTINPSSFSGFQKMQDLLAYNNHLTGSLPATIGSLTRLETLDLSNNQLSGSIPDELGGSTNLEYLYLYQNSLSGKISKASITSLKRLVELKLHQNSLTGELPAGGFDHMVNLDKLYLNQNYFTGYWPEMGNLTSLRYFDASDNTFSKFMRLPADLLGRNCTKLVDFGCDSCNLHGEIPDFLPNAGAAEDDGHFGNMQSLRNLILSNNHLNGTFPLSLQRNRNINKIDLRGSDITGSLPSALFSHPTNLVNIYLQDNSLTGTIPVSSVNSIQRFNADNNDLTGNIPSELFAYNLNLQELRLSNNQLSGPVPSSLGRIEQYIALQTLDLSGNQLTGQLPSNIDLNMHLVEVKLNNNNFSGTLPSGLFSTTKLETLDLSYNSITNLKSDDNIYPFDELIQDEMSQGGYYASFKSLKLNNNNFQGAVPEKFDQMVNLQTLDLSSNNFSGKIPLSWSAFNYLQTIDLASNRIGGVVPPALIANNDYLTKIHFQNNRFNGSLSTAFASPSSSLISSLSDLDLSNNHFTGSLTDLASNIGLLTNLVTLNLGDQLFTSDSTDITSSEINWLANILNQNPPVMEHLDISGTGLHGALSDATAFMTGAGNGLISLDISDNDLSSEIPTSVATLDTLKSFHLSNNAFTGIVPEDICDLASATSISLFPGNTGLTCYPDCLVPLLGGVTTNLNNIDTCKIEPTGQPSGQPTGQPTGEPSGQPTGQPTTAPTFKYYDGKFAQNASLVIPRHVDPKEAKEDRICSGELEIRAATVTTGGGEPSAEVAEVWCIEELHRDEFLQFGVNEKLKDHMAAKNAAGYGPTLDLSTLKTMVFRGKEDINLVSANDGVSSVTALASLYRAGSCDESGSGSGCSSSFNAYTSPTSSAPLWEDTILACPFFSTQAFGSAKTLPVARSETWSYGTSAMIQKIRLMDSLSGASIDNSGANADNLDARVAELFRSGTTSLVGAYLMQKGAAVGGWDRVMIKPASPNWSESSLHCKSSSTGSTGITSGAIDDLGKDFKLEYGAALDGENYISTSRSTALASADIAYENVTITHETLSWATVDITEMVRNQLHYWYLYNPTEALEINLLWVPDYYNHQRQYFRKHFPHQAAGDALGDMDIVMNSTRGRTEWYTSESNDPPLLQLFFQ